MVCLPLPARADGLCPQMDRFPREPDILWEGKRRGQEVKHLWGGLEEF